MSRLCPSLWGIVEHRILHGKTRCTMLFPFIWKLLSNLKEGVCVCVFVVCGVLTLPGLGRGECHPQRSTGATAARRIAIWLQKLLRINFSLKWNFSNKNFWPISWPCFLKGLRRMSSARTRGWWISPPPPKKKVLPIGILPICKKHHIRASKWGTNHF